MTTRTMLEASARVAVIGMAALGCATASRETAHDQLPAPIQSLVASAAFDPSMASLPKRTTDVLTLADISAVPAVTTAYNAVERLRPWFLRTREKRSGINASRHTRPAVFVNGVFAGETEALRAIPISDVVEMRLIRPSDAVHQYGSEHQAGIILVRLK